MTKEQEQAADILVRNLSPKELSGLLNARHNVLLAEEEAGKTHPMSHFMLQENEWQEMRNHLMDGGGVLDDKELNTTIMEALLQDNQEVFWPNLIHLMKAWLKIRGRLQPAPGGGVSMNGAAHEKGPAPHLLTRPTGNSLVKVRA